MCYYLLLKGAIAWVSMLLLCLSFSVVIGLGETRDFFL